MQIKLLQILALVWLNKKEKKNGTFILPTELGYVNNKKLLTVVCSWGWVWFQTFIADEYTFLLSKFEIQKLTVDSKVWYCLYVSTD